MSKSKTMQKDTDDAIQRAAMEFQNTHSTPGKFNEGSLAEAMRKQHSEIQQLKKEEVLRDRAIKLFSEKKIDKEDLGNIFDIIEIDLDKAKKEIEKHEGGHTSHKEPEKKKKSKHSLLEALNEAHKDNFISKSMVEKYKKDIEEGNTKALKSRLKHLDYEHESDDDKEPVEKYVPDEQQYIPVKKSKKEKVVKEKLKPVPLKLIGHELNTRTRKEKMSPEKKRDIYDFIMKFD